MVSPTNEENEQDQQEKESSTFESDSNKEDSSVPDESESQDELSTFDLVKDAIEGDSEESDEDESSKEEESESPDSDQKNDDNDGEDEDSDEITEEELESYKPKTKKRFEKLQTRFREEKALREKAEEDAGKYRQYTSFLEENRISTDEANQLFDIGASMKSNPQRALELITPYYQQLLQMTGNILPPDLKEQVSNGYVTEEAAYEISRLRSDNQTRQAIEQEQQQHQQHQQARQQQEQVVGLQNAVTDWETQWKTSDPDYSVKKDRVLDRVELKLVRAKNNGTLPKTEDEAIALANEAKAEVEAEISQFQPKKPSVNTVEGGAPSNNLPEAKDTRDVIRRTLSV